VRKLQISRKVHGKQTSVVDVSAKTSNFKKSSWKTNNVGFI
jgi:hypothetical protein